MAVKVISCEPVATRSRLWRLVTSLVMRREVALAIFWLGTCLPGSSGHVSEVTCHVCDVTRGQALRET